MEAEDKEKIQQEILKKYPGTDPEIDIDWDMMEISFEVGSKHKPIITRRVRDGISNKMSK